MILEWREDQRYKLWFAWYPVILNGPDEWDRMKRRSARARIAWLVPVWRLRIQIGNYYAIPDADTRNQLLLDSIEGRPTAFETRDFFGVGGTKRPKL